MQNIKNTNTSQAKPARVQVDTTQFAQEGRERNFTEKGQQYFCSLKRKAALEGKKAFLHELSDFEKRITEFKDITEINKLVTSLSIKMNSVSKVNISTTMVNIKAKKAALEKRMQYFKLIAEQERKLEQLKMQGEYEEVSAQENVYETLHSHHSKNS